MFDVQCIIFCLWFATDVNECESLATVCDTHATCNNVPGSYGCVCKPGFKGNGTHCSGKISDFTQKTCIR